MEFKKYRFCTIDRRGLVVPRARKPASLKQGKSESKEQLKKREAIEKQLMGNSDDVKNVPDYLTDEEKVYYKWLIDEVEISGIITNLDKPLVEQTANCLYIMRQCDDHIRKYGILVQKVDRYGNVEDKENPSIKVKLNYQTKYAALCNQLGLSPAARSALAGKQMEAKQQADDPLLKALRGE